MKMACYVDWLAIQYEGTFFTSHPFTFQKLGYSSRQFRELWDVYYYDELWGHISAVPVLPSLSRDYFILKLENKMLYHANCWDSLFSFHRSFGVEPKGISRCDICADFNELKDGARPENIIREVMSGEIDNLNKMTVQAVRGPKGDDPYESFTMGSRTSAVRVYLYNKTKEMQDVKWKEWIVASDRANGIDWDKPVWRLEFSLKTEALSWMNSETGEIDVIKVRDLFDPIRIASWFMILQSKYFRFVHHSTDTNRYRHHALTFFYGCDLGYRRLYTRDMVDHTRADKIFVAKLSREINDDFKTMPENRFAVCDWAARWAGERGLHDYLNRRRLNFEL